LAEEMADGLDIVSIRLTDEGSVVVRVAFWTQPRRTIVGSRSDERGGVKGIDYRPAFRGEGDQCDPASVAPPGAS
jgi:hypothetical protein